MLFFCKFSLNDFYIYIFMPSQGNIRGIDLSLFVCHKLNVSLLLQNCLIYSPPVAFLIISVYVQSPLVALLSSPDPFLRQLVATGNSARIQDETIELLRVIPGFLTRPMYGTVTRWDLSLKSHLKDN